MVRMQKEDSTTSVMGMDHSASSPHAAEASASAPAIADRENKAVARSKIFVHLFLLVAAAICGYVTYKVTSAQETNAFENEFSNTAREVISVAQDKGDKVAGVMNEFSILLTTHALSINATWPYVTLPFFESRGEAARAITKFNSLFTVVLNIDEDNKEEWLNYTVSEQNWINDDREALGSDLPLEPPINDFFTHHSVRDGLELRPYEGMGPYTVIWQNTPYFWDSVNVNTYTIGSAYVEYVKETGTSVLSLTFEIPGHYTQPAVFYYHPVFDSLGTEEEQEVVALISAVMQWSTFFDDVMSEGEGSVYCVLNNACANQTFTYLIDGPTSEYLGPDDFHDTKYDDLNISSSFLKPTARPIIGGRPVEGYTGEKCEYVLHMYPTSKMEENSRTMIPIIFSATVVLVFFFTAIVFSFYDFLVQRRQERVMDSAVRTNAIVDSLFPAQFRDQILQEQRTNDDTVVSANRNKGMIRDFIAGRFSGGGDLTKSKPFADFFPQATVMFADIQGFTSWSSMREPPQVFTLLEGIYSAFDKIAKRQGIFKVETVGDAYVAVSGVPTPEKKHAVNMCRFASECARVLPEVVISLERVLGPGTGDLSMRFGLHSGPVTAGVLRGDKARFQLFGDTVNTAARIESTGRSGRIHVSEHTAEALKSFSKEHWLIPREDKIHARGKGILQTYWLDISGSDSTRYMDGSDPKATGNQAIDRAVGNAKDSDTINRLIDWNVEQLLDMLRQIVAARENGKRKSSFARNIASYDHQTIPLDEVVDIITLPNFDNAKATRQKEEEIDLGDEVREQLSSFVFMVAQSYRRNPFHNFEHASHVTMSVRKLLSRVVAPDVTAESSMMAMALHDHTYGITSDPLTQFAIVVAALIHDVDHPGVSNGQLAKENPALSAKYHQKSMAEQISVDVAWGFLMNEGLEDLRKCIFADAEEYKRFRQIVVQCVMATDIFDKQLSELRKKRWDSAFDETNPDLDEERSTNRKATIVIEHILQASDVAHTMQHWHVYTAWNERLFREMFFAYKEGRSEKDPMDFWYKGEIWFFDMYVIPLAKKLDDCGVFGVSSDECLSYAVENRKEWESKGQEIVKNMAERTMRLWYNSRSEQDIQGQSKVGTEKPPARSTTSDEELERRLSKNELISRSA